MAVLKRTGIYKNLHLKKKCIKILNFGVLYIVKIISDKKKVLLKRDNKQNKKKKNTIFFKMIYNPEKLYYI